MYQRRKKKAQPKNISQIVPFLKPLIEYFPFCKKNEGDEGMYSGIHPVYK